MHHRRPGQLRLPAAGFGTALAAAAVVAVLASMLAPGAPMRQVLGRTESGRADVIVLLLAVGGELLPAPVSGSTRFVVTNDTVPAGRLRSEPRRAAAPSDRIELARLDLPPPRA